MECGLQRLGGDRFSSQSLCLLCALAGTIGRRMRMCCIHICAGMRVLRTYMCSCGCKRFRLCFAAAPASAKMGPAHDTAPVAVAPKKTGRPRKELAEPVVLPNGKRKYRAPPGVEQRKYAAKKKKLWTDAEFADYTPEEAVSVGRLALGWGHNAAVKSHLARYATDIEAFLRSKPSWAWPRTVDKGGPCEAVRGVVIAAPPRWPAGDVRCFPDRLP